MSRGAMSLEMIVGMVILLVVAAVVISTFLNVFPSGGAPPVGQNTVNLQQMKNTCQNYCRSWKAKTGQQALSAALSYCTERFAYDADGDGSLSETAGSGYNTYCEDGVHCFNIQECSDDFVKLDAETCKNLMCKYYQSSRVISNPSKSKAGRRIYLLYQPGVAEGDRGAGTCGMNSITDATGLSIKTWWSTNFNYSSPGDYASICEGISAPPSSGPSNPPPASGGWCEQNNHGTTITNGCVGPTTASTTMSTYCSNNNCPNPQTYGSSAGACSGNKVVACTGQ